MPIVHDFSGTRQLTTGAGGVLCTDEDALAAAARELVHARDAGMSDIAAAVGTAQLEKLPRLLAMRRGVAAEYWHMLRRVDGVTAPLDSDRHAARSWCTYPVLLDASRDRELVLSALAASGIESAPALPGAHVDAAPHPVASAIAARAVVLPCFPHMSPQQQRRVVEALREALGS